jgi:hypothetical protein
VSAQLVEQSVELNTRSDKLAANCLAFGQLASIRPWLRLDELTA